MTSRGIDMIQKYRAWHKKEKKMYYQKDYNITFFADGSWEMWLPEHEPSVICNSENSILLQSTSLKDKNGKEIFEGDIIFWKDANMKYTVYYCKDCGRWEANPISDTPKQEEYGSIFKISKIIGNRFENPELLKGGK